MRSRNPGYPRQSDSKLRKAMTTFTGMLSGEPASELPDGYSALNKNVIDRGEYYEVRNGSRQYSSLRLGFSIIAVDTDTITTDGVHNLNTGDSVWLVGDSLPAPLAENVEYFVIRVDVNKISLALTYSNTISGTVIPFSTTGSGVVFIGSLNGYYDHVASGKVVLIFGNTVFVSDKNLRALTRVTPVGFIRPSGICTIVSHDNDAVIFSSNGIFKLFLGSSSYYMDLINKPVPSVLVTDINQSLPATIYGYLYLYSLATLGMAGNSSRLDSVILFESGTSQNESVKDYGECFFDTPIGVNLSNNHIISTFTVPDGVNNVTHFPLYRTRNIGEYSGGAGTDVSSEGNRRDLFVWAADIPVAKAFVGSYNSGTGVLTISGTNNKFTRNDVGSILRDSAGNTRTISVFTDENTVTTTTLTGSWSTGTVYCFIGSGRGGRASQSGNILDLQYVDVSSVLTASDIGTLIFISDGTTRRIKTIIDSTTAEVVETGDFIDLCATYKPVTGNFSRKWNDTLPDDSQGDGRLSLSDMYAFANEGSDIYVPRRFAIPIPNSDIGVIENGFMIAALRGTGRYYYSQIGDKPYTMGYYNPPYQTRKINGSINFMVIFPSKVIIILLDKTYALILNSSTNSGRSAVGEVIMELPTAECIDHKRGVKAWQTIRFKNQSLLFALTNDLAMRCFDGSSWSNEDLGFVEGKDAVSYKYLKKIDQSVGINAFYSTNAGLKLWFRKWEELVNSSNAIYTNIQLTINTTDTNVQGSIDTYAERESGLSDKNLMVM